jgi:uncharacterized protein (DUF885 family)
VEEVLPGAAREAGWSRLPKGAEAYAAALRGFTTTNLGAAEIHAIGRREVARLEAEAEVILRQLGHTEGTFNERMAKATQGPLVEATDPRAALIARYTEYIRDAERRSEALRTGRLPYLRGRQLRSSVRGVHSRQCYNDFASLGRDVGPADLRLPDTRCPQPYSENGLYSWSLPT